jgi:hypothetical protein
MPPQDKLKGSLILVKDNKFKKSREQDLKENLINKKHNLKKYNKII